MTKILVHSPCGGTGVTTITANLGVALARSGYPVLISGHSEYSVARHFVHWTPPIAELSMPLFHGVRKAQVESQLYLSGESMGEHARVNSTTSLMNVPDASGQFILVESGSKELPSVEELSQFHFLLVVISPDASSFCELAALFKALCKAPKSLGQPQPLVVLNNYTPESLLSRDIHYLLESSLLQSFYADTLLNDESVKEALACGMPLAEHAPYSPVLHALSALAQNLIKWSDDAHAAA